MNSVMKLLMKSYESVAHFKKNQYFFCAAFSFYTRLPLHYFTGDVTIVLCFSPRKTGPIFSSPILGVWMDHHHPVHDGSLPQDALPLHALPHLRWGTRCRGVGLTDVLEDMHLEFSYIL